jgi:biotin carboxylase
VKTLMMIGGGVQEINAVKRARELGYRVLVTDRNPDAPCFAHCDYHAVIDGRDVEGLMAHALLVKEPLGLCGVFTLTELVTSVACVAAACGLRGTSLAAAVACQNKAVAKSIWTARGISTPRGTVAYTHEEALAFLRETQAVFAKPTTSFGGIGAQRIRWGDPLPEIPSHRGLLLEEFIAGTMHDVNAVLDETGRLIPLGIVDREFLPEHPVEIGLRTPSVLTAAQQLELCRLVEAGVNALGITSGPIKADAVCRDGVFYLLEVAPRLHGPRNSLYLLPFAQQDPLRPVLDFLSGRGTPATRLQPRAAEPRHAICRAILPPPGVIESISGIDVAITQPGVEDVLLFASCGQTIPPYRNSTHVPGYVFASGRTREECDAAMNAALDAIRIRTM